jgi:FKBP-type peptidyl-prolyl cis-trans isomerase FkpA
VTKHWHRVAAHGMSIAAVMALLVVCSLSGCNRTSAPAVQPENQVATLGIEDRVVGTGVEATPGSRVTVHYTGWLYAKNRPEGKGAEFDSSRKSGQPFSFKLGGGEVIAGWDQGVAGMRVGGQRRLIIPAAQGYGAKGAGGVIPPGATLLFDVELLDVKPAP